MRSRTAHRFHDVAVVLFSPARLRGCIAYIRRTQQRATDYARPYGTCNGKAAVGGGRTTRLGGIARLGTRIGSGLGSPCSSAAEPPSSCTAAGTHVMTLSSLAKEP